MAGGVGQGKGKGKGSGAGKATDGGKNKPKAVSRYLYEWNLFFCYVFTLLIWMTISIYFHIFFIEQYFEYIFEFSQVQEKPDDESYRFIAQ